MLNLQLLQPSLKDSGHLYRGITHVLKSAIPLELDPSVALLNPAPDADHTVRTIRVPIGDHATPGYFFLPRQANGATVCLVHGTSVEKTCPYFLYIRELLRAGFQVLTFELDGHGDNPRPICCPGLDENVPAAFAFLSEQPEVDPRRIGMLGVSLGGACVLNAAPRVPGIKAIVGISIPHQLVMDEWAKLFEALGLFNPENLPTYLEATPNRLLEFMTSPIRLAAAIGQAGWEGLEEMDLLHPRTLPAIGEVIQYLDPLGNAARLEGTPFLVINGDWDNITPAWQAEDLFYQARGPKALAIVPRRNHFTIMMSRVAVQSTVDWFKRWL